MSPDGTQRLLRRADWDVDGAGIPRDVEFTTEPRLAQAMIGRAIAAGVPFAWFTADEACGQA